jgi:hypothetical protein
MILIHKRLKDMANDVDGSGGKPCSLDAQIERLRETSAYVATAYRIAASETEALKQSLVLFAEANERLVKRLCELEAIVPRRVDVDGRKLRWDAPDDRVPISNF